MERTGRPATGPTVCFIAGGCGAQVFGHTNGRGDFVLFDELGWPWPIHACYLRRFQISEAAAARPLIDITRSRTETLPHVVYSWDTVEEVPPNLMARGKQLNIVGTVTDLKREVSIGPRFESPEERAEVLRRLEGRTDVIEIVDGSTGLRFSAFADLRESPVQIYDTVAAQVTGLDLYLRLRRRPIVVLTKLRVYRGDGHAS